MPSVNGIEVIFGTAAFGTPGRAFNDKSSTRPLFDLLAARGIAQIDTAHFYESYGGAETLIGECGAGAKFSIDTKAYGGFKPGSGTREGIVKDAAESLRKLGVGKVNVFYLHAPDSSVPLAETLAGVNDLHTRGLFTRFGLSNFLAADVQRVYDLCAQNGYVLPSVYQGNYSAFNRAPETLLLPLCRELGIAFYCYSPLAGGIVTKSKQQVLDGEGRFDPSSIFGELYRDLYVRPTLLDALQDWARIAREEGCDRAELAYRWVRFNSPLKAKFGDGMVIGASTVAQAEASLGWLEKGPVSQRASEAIDRLWDAIKGEAALDTVNRGTLRDYSS